MKAGTRIEVQGTLAFPGFPGVAPQMAKIARWTADMARPEQMPAGYHPVRFADGGCLMVHESNFRVIDNR